MIGGIGRGRPVVNRPAESQGGARPGFGGNGASQISNGQNEDGSFGGSGGGFGLDKFRNDGNSGFAQKSGGGGGGFGGNAGRGGGFQQTNGFGDGGQKGDRQGGFGGGGGGSGFQRTGFGGDSGSGGGGGFRGGSGGGGFSESTGAGSQAEGGFAKSAGGGGFGTGGFGGGNSVGGFGKSGGFEESRGGGGSGRECFKCGEDGHMSKECPNSGGGRDNKCFKCGKGGHISKECPDGGGSGCFNCGEGGHMSKECPQPRKPRQGGGACYNCGGEGHLSRDCTEPRKPREGADGDGGAAGGEGGGPKPATYTPVEREIDAIFEEHIHTGINFDRAQEIPVEITGKDTPEKIKSFEEAGFPDQMMNNIRQLKYRTPTPIQQAAIPCIVHERDVMACAQTGSGKTAAFMLPILNWIAENKEQGHINIGEPYAIVIAPTRELAHQIYEETRKFSHGLDIGCAEVYGQVAVGYQLSKMKRGSDVIVATQGRLTDWINRRFIKLTRLKFLVLDEADRMLDMGFIDPIRDIINNTDMKPKEERTTLMFSATFASEVQQMAKEFLSDDYLFVKVGLLGAANQDVTQEIIQIERCDKMDKLVDMLNADMANSKDETGKYKKKTLVFVEQKRMADIVGAHLSQHDITATTIHGDREQRQREEALGEFRRGIRPVLVATAVASRGLDIVGVDHVINYDLPKEIGEYVHRIGRTGRVGNPGRATSFYTGEDYSLTGDLLKILKDAQQVVPEFLEGGGRGSNFESGNDWSSNRGGPAGGGFGGGSKPIDDDEW